MAVGWAVPTRQPYGGGDRTTSRWLAAVAGIVGLAGIVYWQFYAPSPYLDRGEGYASLAAIPFECLTPELEGTNFSAGLNEVLVAELST